MSRKHKSVGEIPMLINNQRRGLQSIPAKILLR
ncbi:MAG: hypothetical protein RIR58_230, partial [Actinomycetota bacterium]